MGNLAGKHLFLEENIEWEDYMQQEWRAERATTLDKYGGLCRAPVRRGNSVNMHLLFLGSALVDQGHAIEKELYKKPERTSRSHHHDTLSKGAGDRRMDLILQRSHDHHSPSQSMSGKPPTLDALADPDALLSRVVVAVRSKVTGHKYTVAEWRVRIHAARRRTMLIVMTAIRLWRGVTAPQRCRRVNGWSWAVADKLGARTPRFVEDQMLCVTLRASIEANKAMLESLCQAFTTGNPDPSIADPLGAMSSIVELHSELLGAGLRGDSYSSLADGSSPYGSVDLGQMRGSRRLMTPSLDARGSMGSSPTQVDRGLSPFLRPNQVASDSGRNAPPSRQASSGNLIQDSPLVHRAKRMLTTSASRNGNGLSDPGNGLSNRPSAEYSVGQQGELDPLQQIMPGMAMSQLFNGGGMSQSARLTSQAGQRSASFTGGVAVPGSRSQGRSMLSRGMLDGARAALISSGGSGQYPMSSDGGQQQGGGNDRGHLPSLHHSSLNRGLDPRLPSASVGASPQQQDNGLTAPHAPGPDQMHHGRSPRTISTPLKAGMAKTRVGFGSGMGGSGKLPLNKLRTTSESGPPPHPPLAPPLQTLRSQSPQRAALALENSHVAHTSHIKLMKHLSPLNRPSTDGSSADTLPDLSTTGRVGRLGSESGSGALHPTPPPAGAMLLRTASGAHRSLPGSLSQVLVPSPPQRPSHSQSTIPATPPTPPQPAVPVLLARTVAAAPALNGVQPKDREEVDEDSQCLNSQLPEEEMDERARWQAKLSKLRRGEPVQPLSVLMKPPSIEPTTPDTPAPPKASVSPPAEADDDAFVKYNYYNEGQDDLISPTTTESPHKRGSFAGSLEPVPSVVRYQQGPSSPQRLMMQNGSAIYDEDEMQDVDGGEWKDQLREEIELMERPPPPPIHLDVITEDDREVAELARLSTPQDAAEQRALDAIQAAAASARKSILGMQAFGSVTNNGPVQGSSSKAAARALSQDRADKILAITRQLEADVEALRAAEARLLMHINRTNCSWAQAQSFQPPDVWGEAEVDLWLASVASDKYKAAMLAGVKAGQVAVQYNAFEDYIQLPSGDMQNLWCAEPWMLLSTCRPGLAAQASSTMVGLTWGGRVIAQLVAGVEAAAGPVDAAAAVANLWVVLALDDEMQHAVVKDMWAHKFYGLKRERVLFTMQTRRPAHMWNDESRVFEEDELSDTFPPGSGVSLMQLSWACEAFTLDQEGAPQPLEGTVLELLEHNQVEWLMSRRARDVGLISRHGAFSMAGLAYASFLRERARSGMITDIYFGKDIMQSRAMDSLVLGCKSIYSAWRLKVGPKALAGLTLASAQSVVELSHLELQSADTAQELSKLKAAMGGKVAVSCGRYLYHLPTLKSVMAEPNIFRPKLQLVYGDRAHVAVHAADLTALPAMRCLGMVARGAEWHGALLGYSHFEKLLNLLQAQDESPDFRKMMSTMPGRAANPRAMPGAGQAATRQQLRTIVVFVINNRVTQTAVDIACSIAKPDRDAVRLVTFVSTDLAREESEELLIRLFRSCNKPGLAMTTDIVVRGENGLLDCMESYLASSKAHMAVMGSAHMTLAAGNFVIGSVALSLVRRVQLPVMVVTANSAKFAEGPRPKLRLGLVVENTCRGVHNFLCDGVGDASRGDTLALIHPTGTFKPPPAVQAAQRRLIDSLHVSTRMHNLTVLRTMAVEGPMDKAVLEAADAAAVNVLGLQVGGHTIPQWMQNVMVASKGAVLVYHSRPEPQRGL